MDKYCKTLELHKVLELLSKECSNDCTRQMALSLEPYHDIADVQRELRKTNQAFELSVKYGSPTFINFKDICGSLARAKSGARLSLRELLDIAKMLSQISMLKEWFSHCEGIETDLDYMFSRLYPNKFLQQTLEMSILSEDEIADSASSQLASIRKKITQSGAKLRGVLDKMIKNSSVQKCLQDNIVTMRDGRYVLPVKSEHKGDVQGLIHDTSSSGQTIFIEPMAVVEANNEIRLLQALEQEEIDRIIVSLCQQCAECAESIIESYKVCTELNLYFAKANLGAKMKASTPIASDDGIIILKKARHPLLDMKKAVPIDISLGDEYKTLIVTGANTGGKTVSMKTVGLLTLMAMCGMMIPASDGSKISVFDNILADIGDSQSIEQNLSTFSAHTNKVVEILHTANKNSLILIDELGSGTDPVEGSALAIAIIEKLRSKGAKLMVTTHYQELKLYAIETDEVENASCEFDIETLKPTYRIIIGSPGKSNAFAISESLGMPADVISHAKSLVDSENLRIEKVIEKLEDTRISLEYERDTARRLRNEAEATAKELALQRDELLSTKSDILEKAREDASVIIERTRAESNQLLDELDKLRKAKEKEDFSSRVTDAKSRAKKTFNKMYDRAVPEYVDKNAGYKLPRDLKRGDTVEVVDMNYKKGIVASEKDDNGFIYVQLGIMKTKINISKLRLCEPEKVTYQNKKIRTATQNVRSKIDRSIQLELDIRGQSADDGVHELDSFIDNAVMSGVNTVTVIHGKGTGILRKAVHKRLKQIKSVKSFRLGVYGEGEDGVTIVELK